MNEEIAKLLQYKVLTISFKIKNEIVDIKIDVRSDDDVKSWISFFENIYGKNIGFCIDEKYK